MDNVRLLLFFALAVVLLMIYQAWEPYQFEKWKSYDTAIPGLVKWLDLAAGYGHLNYYRWNWCTQPIDRAVSVEVEKA